MPYAVLEDGFVNHPRFVALQDHYAPNLDTYMAAVGLWAAAISYSSTYLTDGAIPAGAIGRLYPGPTPNHLIDGLTHPTVGLWTATGTGWLIRDYLQRNRSAVEVKAKREQAAEAGRAGGLAKAAAKGPRTKPRKQRPPSESLDEPLSETPQRPLAEKPSVSSSSNCTSLHENNGTSHVTGTRHLSSGSGGRDDDIDHILTAVGNRRHADALAAGKVHGTTRSAKRAHQRACVADAVADSELRSQALAAVAAHPDWTPEQVAERLDADDLAPPRPAPAPTCPHCHGTHSAGFLCPLDPTRHTQEATQ